MRLELTEQFKLIFGGLISRGRFLLNGAAVRLNNSCLACCRGMGGRCGFLVSVDYCYLPPWEGDDVEGDLCAWGSGFPCWQDDNG